MLVQDTIVSRLEIVRANAEKKLEKYIAWPRSCEVLFADALAVEETSTLPNATSITVLTTESMFLTLFFSSNLPTPRRANEVSM